MHAYIILAVVILALGITRALKHQNHLKQFSLILTAAISLAITVLTIPYFMLEQYDLPILFIKAFRYGAGAVGMSVDAGIVAALQLASPLKEIYTTLLYSLYVAGPIAASLVVISFSRTLMELLIRRKYTKRHIFSELNEASIRTAESLQDRKDELVIFCNTGSVTDESLKARAHACHAVLSGKSETDIQLSLDSKNEYYIMYKDPRKVLAKTEELCSSLSNRHFFSQDRVLVRCFTGRENMELIRHLDRKHGHEVPIRYMDPAGAAAIGILRELKDTLMEKDHQEIFLFGNTPAADALLRNLSCLLIQPDMTYRIHVFTKNAQKLIRHYKTICPEFLNREADAYLGLQEETGMHCPIHFHTYDPEIIPEELSFLSVPDIIFTAEEDDLANYTLSKTMKRFYASQNDALCFPKLCVFLQDPHLNSLLKEKDLIFFGDTAKLYAYENIVTPELEESAKRTHLSYLSASVSTILDASVKEQNKALDETGYYAFSNQESSFSMALALEYRIAWILARKDQNVSDAEYIESWLAVKENLQKMADAEHLRWNCAQRLLGYTLPTAAQEKVIAERQSGKKVKDDDLLLHPALVSNAELPEAEALADRILRDITGTQAKTNYTALDKTILLNMIRITGFQNK